MNAEKRRLGALGTIGCNIKWGDQYKLYWDDFWAKTGKR